MLYIQTDDTHEDCETIVCAFNFNRKLKCVSQLF